MYYWQDYFNVPYDGVYDSLSSYIKLIEKEVGLPPLTTLSTAYGHSTNHDHHPVYQWREAVINNLKECKTTGRLKIDNSVLSLVGLAQEIKIARTIPNYNSAIRPRLRNPRAFVKAQFELYVGAIYASTGYKTEFLLPLNIPKARTADLKLISNGVEILVECTRKEGYNPQSADADMIRRIRETILELQRECQSSYEIIVIVLGAIDPNKEAAIIYNVRTKLAQNFEGYFVSREIGCGLAFKKLKPMAPGIVASFLPFSLKHGISEITVAADENGQMYGDQPRRVGFYLIDSHKMESVLRSFENKRKRKQIPLDGKGLIYINLDVSNVVPEHISTYLELLGRVVGGHFLPGTDSNLAAVVLTTTPQIERLRKNTDDYLGLLRRTKAIRNPHSTLPEDFRIPSELSVG